VNDASATYLAIIKQDSMFRVQSFVCVLKEWPQLDLKSITGSETI